jgi:peptidoglycan/xylan/chitin deacetylase (PgdA/CDA1 family)
MSLATVMYHFVYDGPPAGLGRLPYLPTAVLREHLDYMCAHGTPLRPGEAVEDFAGVDAADRFFVTFDDSLKCHHEVVAPILHEFGVQGGFSIYTEPVIHRRVSVLEKQRYLQYALWDYPEFLKRFVEFARASDTGVKYGSRLRTDRDYMETHSFYLAEETYYSMEERYFRYVRDVVFEPADFARLIGAMFDAYCDEAAVAAMMFMSPAELREISEAGHTILAHSASHPIRMDLMSREQMASEVAQSLDDLAKLLGGRPTGFAYPCGRVNPVLFEVVRDAGIRYAFVGGDSSNFSVPGPEQLKRFRADAADFTHVVRGK